MATTADFRRRYEHSDVQCLPPLECRFADEKESRMMGASKKCRPPLTGHLVELNEGQECENPNPHFFELYKGKKVVCKPGLECRYEDPHNVRKGLAKKCMHPFVEKKIILHDNEKCGDDVKNWDRVHAPGILLECAPGLECRSRDRRPHGERFCLKR